ncbi:MAG: peptidase [Gemmatimonadetes bacterium]|nr:peptidase [Gemmatimonadota bacterium]
MPFHFSLSIRATALGAALSIANVASAQQLAPVEQRVRSYLQQHRADEVALLAKSVNIKSQTLDLAGVRAVGALYGKELEALGFKTRWVSMPAAMHRAGHLVAERTGGSGKRLLLIGHLDTVVEGDTLGFAMLDTVTAKGAGGNDMKGGDVAIIYALKALDAAGALDNTSITVIMTGDEEAAGDPLSVARAPLIDAAKHSDIALGFEGGNPSDATVARRGASSWLLTVSGKGAHSAGIFSQGAGYGAIYEAARILNEFRVQLAGTPNLTFNPSVIVGGTDVTYDSMKVAGTSASKLNIIAANVSVSGDLRFLTEGQKDSTRARMRGIATHDNLAGTSAKIDFADEYPAMAPTPANYAVLAVYDSASRALGYGPVAALDPSRRGAGDISFVGPLIPGLDGLGAMGSGSHTPNERVDLRSLPMQTERAALLIYRLTRPASSRAVTP